MLRQLRGFGHFPRRAGSTTAVSRGSTVGNHDRVDLDEVKGIGQCLYADQYVGGLVVPEQRCPGLLDHP